MTKEEQILWGRVYAAVIGDAAVQMFAEGGSRGRQYRQFAGEEADEAVRTMRVTDCEAKWR